MRIDHLDVQNFKCFSKRSFDFHPQINLFVGENGSGKSSVLDALSVAAGSWFLGIRGCDSRGIANHEVRLVGGKLGTRITFEPQFPVQILVRGEVQGRVLSWLRSLNSFEGRTTYADASDLKNIAAAADDTARSFGDVTLPVVTYYGTGRLWQSPRSKPQDDETKLNLSRLDGYENSINPRTSARDLIRWLRLEAWEAFQDEVQETPQGRIVKGAILSCVEGAVQIYYSAKRSELEIEISGHGPQPFSNLSDGQRNMLAMVADIAIKAARLNPHLDSDVLRETPGVVLIDELDLHLHPKWQHRVVEDLRQTFPRMQFFATSHSPFIVQTLREGELIVLDGEPKVQYEGKGVEEVARHIMGVDTPEMSPRYKEMVETAKQYFKTLEQADGADEETKQALKARLEAMTAPYSDNPAYVAFLEMKRGAAGLD